MKFDKSLMTGSTTLLLLSLLGGGDKYGYQMIRELEAKSDRTFLLKEGTIYPILHALEKSGIVRSHTDDAGSGRIRRYYGITAKGVKLLTEKKEEWNAFSTTVNRVIGGAGYAAG